MALLYERQPRKRQMELSPTLSCDSEKVIGYAWAFDGHLFIFTIIQYDLSVGEFNGCGLSALVQDF